MHYCLYKTDRGIKKSSFFCGHWQTKSLPTPTSQAKQESTVESRKLTTWVAVSGVVW